MESTNNHLFLCEFKELRKELSAVKKRIVQLEESHEKQQERINILEKENDALKTELALDLSLNGMKEGGLVLKRKRTEKDQAKEKETELKTTSVSNRKKKAKTKTNNIVLPQYDNGDSFDSLSDDLLHKIVEFNGNCYSVYGLINKRCQNIYDMKEYKLKKETCVFGYGTVDMMLEHYLQKRREGELYYLKICIAAAVVTYNRLDAIDWIIQLGDVVLLQTVCNEAVCYRRFDILTKVFLQSNLTLLDELLNDTSLCYCAAYNGKLETLKWLRNHSCSWSASSFAVAKRKGHDEIVQYLRLEGCPESPENSDESTVDSDNEEGDDEDADEDADESVVSLEFIRHNHI